ncbi:MAG TPA: MBL fold metallo-hydrolase [Tepidisphaeraceae bacterium]|jgi:glyoxylase-like metal-dependent hydrolase (beta-lactamase superfamily II)
METKSEGGSPQYRWQLIRAGPLRLDGGSMFGVVPRVVWQKMIAADERGRVVVAHNCLLLEEVDGKSNILIETGSGDKLDTKMSDIFGLGDVTVESALQSAGWPCEKVDHVIVTHLHFDHAGGATRRTRAGEKSDWTAGNGMGVKRTFPNAAVIVQRREWEDALANRSTMTRTYLKENLEPLRQQLRLIDSPQPFAPGYIPQRDELPATSVRERETEVLPGISVFVVPGHTWAQQAVKFTDDRGRTVVFGPDVLPTIHHVGAAYNMAYDQEPFMSTVSRHWYLEEAVRQGWLLVLDHEPGNPLQRATRDGKGWYQLHPEEA